MAAPGSTSPSLDASLIALNFQHRGTLPRLKPYRLEVSTPETSPNWTPPPCTVFARRVFFVLPSMERGSVDQRQLAPNEREKFKAISSAKKGSDRDAQGKRSGKVYRIKAANMAARRARRSLNRVQPAVTIRALFVMSADRSNRATKRAPGRHHRHNDTEITSIA